MRVAVYCDHVGSSGIAPNDQYGGGEFLTLGYLHILSQHYDVIPIVNNYIYPNFDHPGRYGLPEANYKWKPIGTDMGWIRNFDVFINISHGRILPPICRRNILVVMFPQHKDWDVSGYDTIISISEYTAKWVKRYWGRDSDVVYPPLPVQAMTTTEVQKYPQIISVGRFFRVPGGNNKGHEVLIKSFQNLFLEDWKLKLVGSIQDRAYYNEMRALAGDDQRIEFVHDLSREQYMDEMRRSQFLWAATGYQSLAPSSKEHFGIIAVEAMASGTVPIVNNSGGTPETGALTWDKPVDLTEMTRKLIEDRDRWMDVIKGQMQGVMKFDLSNNKPLLDVMEKVVVIQNDPSKGRIYSDYSTPDKVKIGILSDSPNSTLGFGVVTRSLIREWQKMGFRIAAFGRHDPPSPHPKLPPEDIMAMFNQVINDDRLVTGPQQMAVLREKLADRGEICTIWRDPRDGWDGVIDFIKHEKPDVLYMNYDIGNIRSIIDTIRAASMTMPPFVAYFPVEGFPLLHQYNETIRLIRLLNGVPVTYTKFGAMAIAQSGGPQVDYVWHGADHANFRRLDEQTRNELRFSVGVHDKFVCMFVGRNKRTKGILGLIEAIKVLKNMGRHDIVFYIHTWPNDRMPNSSAPLEEIVRIEGIEDMVIFPDEDFNQVSGVPFDKEIIIHAQDTNDLKEVQRINLKSMNMVERYNLADLYVNCSEIGGFELPLVEAMGCGLPILSVDDKAAQREVLGDTAMYVDVAHWDRFHTWAKLAQFNPEQMAQAIHEISMDPKTLAEFRLKSSNRWQQFKWKDTAKVLADEILEQHLL